MNEMTTFGPLQGHQHIARRANAFIPQLEALGTDALQAKINAYRRCVATGEVILCDPPNERGLACAAVSDLQPIKGRDWPFVRFKPRCMSHRQDLPRQSCTR